MSHRYDLLRSSSVLWGIHKFSAAWGRPLGLLVQPEFAIIIFRDLLHFWRFSSTALVFISHRQCQQTTFPQHPAPSRQVQVWKIFTFLLPARNGLIMEQTITTLNFVLVVQHFFIAMSIERFRLTEPGST